MSELINFIEPTPVTIEAILEDIKQMYRNGVYSNMGPFEKKFENKLSSYIKGSSKINVHTIMVSNATMALILAIKALFPPKGYVILPSFSFAATLQSVIWNNLVPIFVDIDKTYWSIAMNEKVEDMAKKGKIAGVIFCNPFGIPGKVNIWETFSNKYNIPLIIDSAAGLGASYSKNTKMGLKGNAEIFSLHITKTFGVGEGGIISTRDGALAKKLQMMKNFGFDKNHVVQHLGLNAKSPEFTSIVALKTLKKFGETIKEKREMIRYYGRNLSSVIGSHPNILNSSPQFYPALFPTRKQRDHAEKILNRNLIQTRRYYFPPLHKHPPFRDIEKTEPLTNTESISDRILALPMHLNLKHKNVKRICELINSSL